MAALTGRDVPIERPEYKWERYDLICLGGSVRNYAPAQPLISYLRGAPDLQGKPVACFLSCGGMPGPAPRRLTQMVRDRGGRVVASCVIKPASLLVGILGLNFGHSERIDMNPLQGFSKDALASLSL